MLSQDLGLWRQSQEDRGSSYGLQSKTIASLGYVRLSFKERERKGIQTETEEINNTCILDEKIVLGKNHCKGRRVSALSVKMTGEEASRPGAW